MQFAKNTRMSYYIQAHFEVCKPQSSAQRKIRHIRHSVSRHTSINKAEKAQTFDSSLTDDSVLDMMTDKTIKTRLSVSTTLFGLQNTLLRL